MCLCRHAVWFGTDISWGINRQTMQQAASFGSVEGHRIADAHCSIDKWLGKDMTFSHWHERLRRQFAFRIPTLLPTKKSQDFSVTYPGWSKRFSRTFQDVRPTLCTEQLTCFRNVFPTHRAERWPEDSNANFEHNKPNKDDQLLLQRNIHTKFLPPFFHHLEKCTNFGESSSLERSVDRPQTAGLVIQQFKTAAEDVFISSVGPKCSVKKESE